jgi:mono/diheme cytochrome c family protein
VTVAALSLTAWTSRVAAQDKPAATTKPAAGGSAVVRGKYLVTVIGCGECHTPLKMGANGPEFDEARMLSGHPGSLKLPPPPTPVGAWAGFFPMEGAAFAGPWGISYPANLTSDKETGLGTWTEQQFMDTIRTGRHQGRGRELLPPMPWKAFRNLTDADLRAVFAYLRSIPAVSNKVPDPVIPAAPTGK